MGFLLVGVAALGLGLFGGSQIDDAVEVATGEKDSIPILQILLVIVVLGMLYAGMRRFAK